MIIPEPRHKTRKHMVLWLTAYSLTILTVLALAFLQPWAEHPRYKTAVTVHPETKEIGVATAPVELVWPSYGRAAIGTLGGGLRETHGGDGRYPTASMAKVITVLTVLDARPLALGESGPILTMTQRDVDWYLTAEAGQGTFLPVSLGQQLSQRDIIEGIMLASSNNLSNTLAVWAFGSLAGYKQAAMNYLASHGLNNTVVSARDASGAEPDTISTIRDLFELGRLAIQHPVLSEVVATRTIDWPDYGVVINHNELLAKPGYIGVKTGYTGAAGAGVIFAREVESDGQTEVIVGVVAGMGSYGEAFYAADRLAGSVLDNFGLETVVPAGTLVGRYYMGADDPEALAVTAEDLRVWRWRDTETLVSVELDPARLPVYAGQVVGTVRSGETRVDAVLAQ